MHCVAERPWLPAWLRPRVAMACAAVAVAAMGAAPPVQASQSLRCNGHLVGKGESPVVLLHRCGEPVWRQPVWRQPVCVPMLQLGWVLTPYRQNGPGAVLAAQCVPMEEWTYDRGPGSFLGVVRLYNGVIESVRDGARMR